MKRPEKKKPFGKVAIGKGKTKDVFTSEDKAHNQAYDEWEAYLPSDEEIAQILSKWHRENCEDYAFSKREDSFYWFNMAIAISKRLRGKV